MKKNGGNGHHLNGFDEPPVGFEAPAAANDAPLDDGLDPVALAGIPVPDRRWVVPDWIPWGRVTGLYGHGGEGKTLTCQQLITAAAIHEKWLGLVTVAMKTMGFFCEDDRDDMHIRQDAINRLYGCTWRDLSNMRWYPRLGFDNTLMRVQGDRMVMTPLVNQIIERALSFGAQLVVIDTVADTFDGDENNRVHVRRYVQMCLAHIARSIGGTVLATAHPSRAGMRDGSGDGASTQWHNSFRSRAALSTPVDQNGRVIDDLKRVLRRHKNNYGPRSDDLELVWQKGVLVPTGTGYTLPASVRSGAVDECLVGIVKKCVGSGFWLNETAAHRNHYGPHIAAGHPDNNHHFSKDEFQEALLRLRLSGRVQFGKIKDGAGRYRESLFVPE